MDENTREETETTPAPEKKPEKTKDANGNKMLFIGVIAGVLVINAAAAFFLVKMTTPKKEVAQDSKKAESTKIEAESSAHVGKTTAETPIEATVNIAGTDGERFIKVAVAFEFDNVAHPELGEALDARVPKIKDILIDHLSKLTLIEVTGPDAKDKIRKNILRLVNKSIPAEEGHIRDVYIVNYIIQ